MRTQSVIVTGASTGIGRAIAGLFLDVMDSDLDLYVRVNLKGTFFTTHVAGHKFA